MIPHLAGLAPARSRTMVGLAAVLGVALAVRMVHLDTDPIWYDEAATIGIASMDWHVILGAMAQVESSPPGYYVAVKLWSMLLDDSIWWLRMLSVLAGIGAIIPVFLLARSAFGAPAGWIAAGFIALAASHVRFSQDARCYALLFLVTAAAMLAGARLGAPQPGPGAARDRRGPAIALGVLMGVSLWVHATAGFIVVGLNLFVLVLIVQDPVRLRRGLVLLAAADLLMLMIAARPLWAILAHLGADDGYIDRWIVPPGTIDALRLYGRTLVAPFLYTLSPVALVLHVLLIGATALAWWRRRNPMLPALAVMLTASLVLLPLASQFRPILLDRTVLFALIPLVLLLAAGVTAPSHPRGARIFIALVVAAVLLLQAIGVERWLSAPLRKERWDGAAEQLQARLQPGEAIVLPDSSFASISLARHLSRIGAPVPRMISVPPSSPLEQLVAQQLMPGSLTDASGLCAKLGHALPGLWLVMRELPVTVAEDGAFTTRHAVHEALQRNGASLRETLRQPGIALQHWTAPRC